MTSLLPTRVFVTGTDTDIGKTLVAALLTAGLNAVYWKPVQSGTIQDSDTDMVRKLTGLSDTHFPAPAYELQAPLSPHLAAARENITLDPDTLQLPVHKDTDSLVVEGAGGLMVPLNETRLMIDLIKHLGLPVILVASNRLGTINQTLLSLEALTTRNIPVAGVILNRGVNADHAASIEHFGRVRVLAQIPELPNPGPQTIKACFARHFTV